MNTPLMPQGEKIFQTHVTFWRRDATYYMYTIGEGIRMAHGVFVDITSIKGKARPPPHFFISYPEKQHYAFFTKPLVMDDEVKQ